MIVDIVSNPEDLNPTHQERNPVIPGGCWDILPECNPFHLE